MNTQLSNRVTDYATKVILQASLSEWTLQVKITDADISKVYM